MSKTLKLMQPLQVRVLSKNTMRAYELAARDFQAVTGRNIHDADPASITAFIAWMKKRRLSVNTIRARLSAVSVFSGEKIDLPKRERSTGHLILSSEQVRMLMAVVTDQHDRHFLMKLLMLGPKARTIDIPVLPFGYSDETTERVLDAQQASRKIKRYARRAGLDEKKVSLRVWCHTGQVLINSLGARELINVIGHNPDSLPSVTWRPFHGIGRRSRR